MTDLHQTLLTSAVTTTVGVLVYVTGQLASKFLIDPIHEQKKLLGEIADALIFHANVYNNPGDVEKEMMDAASSQFRQQATRLHSKTHLIPWYNLLSKLKIVIERNNIKQASSELVGLSNSVHRSSKSGENRNNERADKIETLLGLRIK